MDRCEIENSINLFEPNFKAQKTHRVVEKRDVVEVGVVVEVSVVVDMVVVVALGFVSQMKLETVLQSTDERPIPCMEAHPPVACTG